MLSHANMIKELVTRAANRFAELKTMPAASIPATIDKDQSDDQNGKRLQGSILRVAQPQGGPKYFAVAVLGQAFKMTAQGPKLSLIDKWGEAAKEKKLSDLGREEDISVVVGVLTLVRELVHVRAEHDDIGGTIDSGRSPPYHPFGGRSPPVTPVGNARSFPPRMLYPDPPKRGI